MLPTGFRTFHFVSILYVFFLFFSFSFVSFLFSLFCFRFFCVSFFFRFFSLLFSLFSFRFFSFRFFSFLFVFFRFSVYRYPKKCFSLGFFEYHCLCHTLYWWAISSKAHGRYYLPGYFVKLPTVSMFSTISFEIRVLISFCYQMFYILWKFNPTI